MTDPEIRETLRTSVRRWVEREVLPVASTFEHADEYPAALVDEMRTMGRSEEHTSELQSH